MNFSQGICLCVLPPASAVEPARRCSGEEEETFQFRAAAALHPLTPAQPPADPGSGVSVCGSHHGAGGGGNTCAFGLLILECCHAPLLPVVAVVCCHLPLLLACQGPALCTSASQSLSPIQDLHWEAPGSLLGQPSVRNWACSTRCSVGNAGRAWHQRSLTAPRPRVCGTRRFLPVSLPQPSPRELIPLFPVDQNLLMAAPSCRQPLPSPALVTGPGRLVTDCKYN